MPQWFKLASKQKSFIMRLIVTLCTILWLSFPSFSQEVAIIPKPVSLQQNKGSFTISKKTVMVVKDDEDRKSADFFNDYLQDIYGFKLDIDKQESKNYIPVYYPSVCKSTGQRRIFIACNS